MRLTERLRFVACITLLCVLAGCQGPHARPKITPAAPTETPLSPAAQSAEASRPTRIGNAPDDIHGVDWANIAIDGAFCDVPGLVRLRPHARSALSTTHGQVQIGSYDKPVYGDVSGDRGDEVAVSVACDNGGGTASGQLGFAYAIYAKRGRDLMLLGTVTSQHNPPRTHVTLLSKLRLGRGRITVRELWYRSSDGTCCPTGEALTRWTVRHDVLTPHPPEILR